MTTSTMTPEHLRHYEWTDSGERQPFAEAELAAIDKYLAGSTGPHSGAAILQDCLDCIDFAPITERGEVVVPAADQVQAAFSFLTQWYGMLDTLLSDLGTEPADQLSPTAVRYLTTECNQWYHKLHEVRREACRAAYGTAGPQPEVDAGNLTFFDTPGFQLDGTIAAESQ